MSCHFRGRHDEAPLDILTQTQKPYRVPNPFNRGPQGGLKTQKHTIMRNFFRVVAQGEALFVPSQKADGGQLQKCNVVLQEIGGKYGNCYVATLFGEQASIRFSKDELVAASLRFSTREYNGQVYQDIVVNEIIPLNKS